MKYEVINISTTTERYIANGILTHNKNYGFGCPSGTSYTSKGVQAIYKRPFIYYQSSYAPSLPITITYSSNTDVTKNYFTYADVDDSTVFCQGSAAYPMTKTSFVSASVAVTTNATNTKMTYVPASFGWQSNYFVSFSVSYLTSIGDPGTFYWSAKLSATDASSRAADNNYPNAYYSYANGSFTVACLTPDTLIEIVDGKTVFLKDLEVGDKVLSIDPNTKEYESSIITSKTYHKVNELYLINNGLLRCSQSHKHVVKRNDIWITCTSDELAINDVMMTKDFEEIIINEIDILN